jgi:K+/H+ antiporter YhaU regulatory subunit KhtT
MGPFLAVIPLIIIVVVSTIIVRTSAVMLKMTGLDERTARFQALSAFTGTGFTTRDSELITANEIRRRIISVLMILGNAGFISVITTFVISFIRDQGGAGSIGLKLGLIAFVLFVLYKLSQHKALTRIINRKIEEKVAQIKILEPKPLEEIVNLPKGYGIFELKAEDSFREKGKTLGDSHLRDHNIMVLNIEKKDRIISSPKAEDVIELGDVLICYGPSRSIRDYLFS